jgi:hypothetical protein
MPSDLFVASVLMIVGIIAPLFVLIRGKQKTYGSELEEYVTGQNPQDIADVERLTTQYERKSKESFI